MRLRLGRAAAGSVWYFRRNRSTRPAVSTSRCLPVKYGWHCAQTSTWIERGGGAGLERVAAGAHGRELAVARVQIGLHWSAPGFDAKPW